MSTEKEAREYLDRLKEKDDISLYGSAETLILQAFQEGVKSALTQQKVRDMIPELEWKETEEGIEAKAPFGCRYTCYFITHEDGVWELLDASCKTTIASGRDGTDGAERDRGKEEGEGSEVAINPDPLS